MTALREPNSWSAKLWRGEYETRVDAPTHPAESETQRSRFFAVMRCRRAHILVSRDVLSTQLHFLWDDSPIHTGCMLPCVIFLMYSWGTETTGASWDAKPWSKPDLFHPRMGGM